MNFSMSLTDGQDTVDGDVTITFDQKIVSGALAVPATTSVDYVIAIDPDQVKAYAIVSDQNVTLTTTNVSGTPDVINLVANEPVFWTNKMQWANGHFANRVAWTKWTFSAAPAAAVVRILVATDATP